MAPNRADNTRKRKRKARTEVSSSSSSSDSSSESEKPSSSPLDNQTSATNNQASAPPDYAPSEVSESSPPAPAVQQTPKDTEKAFEDFYLKQATKEFANDIEKLRSAPDFNERNVPILIRALKQGTACFGEDERRKIGAAGA